MYLSRVSLQIVFLGVSMDQKKNICLTCCSKTLSWFIKSSPKSRCLRLTMSSFIASISRAFVNTLCNFHISIAAHRKATSIATQLNRVCFLTRKRLPGLLKPCSSSECDMLRFSREMFKNERLSSVITFSFDLAKLPLSHACTKVIVAVNYESCDQEEDDTSYDFPTIGALKCAVTWTHEPTGIHVLHVFIAFRTDINLGIAFACL